MNTSKITVQDMQQQDIGTPAGRAGGSKKAEKSKIHRKKAFLSSYNRQTLTHINTNGNRQKGLNL